jgi:peptide deformylase
VKYVAIRDILFEGNPVLRKTSKPVRTIDEHIIRLLDDMLETLHKAEGIGLAAPQVGVLRRVVIVEVEGVLHELINPEIIDSEGVISDVEGCLSLPGKAGMVERPQKVRICALDRNGQIRQYEGEGLVARAFCHETDHLDGKLYIDIMTEEVDLNKKEEAGEDDAEGFA